MQTEQILMTTSEKATTAIKRLRLVNFQGGQAEDGEAQSDAQGRAITLASGVAAGRTRDAATAAGEIIRIMR
jgi:hypothetical protein